jgi:hypothetical protein
MQEPRHAAFAAVHLEEKKEALCKMIATIGAREITGHDTSLQNCLDRHADPLSS